MPTPASNPVRSVPAAGDRIASGYSVVSNGKLPDFLRPGYTGEPPRVRNILMPIGVLDRIVALSPVYAARLMTRVTALAMLSIQTGKPGDWIPQVTILRDPQESAALPGSFYGWSEGNCYPRGLTVYEPGAGFKRTTCRRDIGALTRCLNVPTTTGLTGMEAVEFLGKAYEPVRKGFWSLYREGTLPG